MSTFTALSAWEHARDRAAANQIINAYSERRQCIGDSAVSALSAGDNAQDTAYWMAMQDWCEASCTSFVDHTATIEGASAITMFTLSTWRTEAGIADGFRRATTQPADWTDYDDPAYSYGTIEPGDIRGPWIFADLQKALHALKKTKKTAANSSIQYKVSQGFYEASAAAAVAEASSAWPGSWTDSDAYLSLFYEAEYNVYTAGGDYFATVYRVRAEAAASSIPVHISHSAVAYGYYQKYWNDSTYWDADSLGFDENTYHELQAYSSATTSSRAVDALSYSTFPPAPSSVGYGSICIFYPEIVLAWNFTYTL